MYERDGIVYASEPCEGMSVTGVKDVGDYILLVTFSTGETRLVDCTELFRLPAFEKLANKQAFGTLEVADGKLMWLDGKVDIAPEGLYARSYEYPSGPMVQGLWLSRKDARFGKTICSLTIRGSGAG